MQLSVNGVDTFVATGGKPFEPSLPAMVLLHGAGFDHSTWALHSRWFAHHGYSVLAPDLPGHGRSSGKPLPTIADMADWTAALLDAAGARQARLVVHSMGSLIALETAARHPDRVSGLSLIGTAATMTVGPDLLKAAEANDSSAIDMVSIWGLGLKAELGGSLAPGLWMHQGSQRAPQRPQRLQHLPERTCCGSSDQSTCDPDPRRARHDDPCQSRQGTRRRDATRPHRGIARRRPHDDDRAARRIARGVERRLGTRSVRLLPAAVAVHGTSLARGNSSESRARSQATRRARSAFRPRSRLRAAAAPGCRC